MCKKNQKFQLTEANCMFAKTNLCIKGLVKKKYFREHDDPGHKTYNVKHLDKTHKGMK